MRLSLRRSPLLRFHHFDYCFDDHYCYNHYDGYYYDRCFTLDYFYYGHYRFFDFSGCNAFADKPIRLRLTSTEMIWASMISPTASTSDGC